MEEKKKKPRAVKWSQWQCDCGEKVKFDASGAWRPRFCPNCGRPECWVRKYEIVTK
jgi:hypothetical protein